MRSCARRLRSVHTTSGLRAAADMVITSTIGFRQNARWGRQRSWNRNGDLAVGRKSQSPNHIDGADKFNSQPEDLKI